MALAAVVLAVSAQLSHPDGLLLAVLPALGGIGTAVQQAINGRVARTASRDAYGAVAAGVVNFLVGFVALLVVFLVDLALRGAPQHLPSEPWLYLGGACGVIFISAAAAVVRVVGVFVLGLGTIAGQLIASLFIDLFVPGRRQGRHLPGRRRHRAGPDRGGGRRRPEPPPQLTPLRSGGADAWV